MSRSAAALAALGVLLAAPGYGAQGRPIAITHPMTVGGSTEIRPGKYVVKESSTGVLRVDADNAVIDFKGATLRSRDDVWRDLDRFEGAGILIQGRKNVTIRNARVEGYRWNVFIVDCENVRLENCDFGLSRAIPMLKDGRPVDTFLNLRDANAWRQYGAGIWMERSKGCVVTKCRATGAQNGLLMVDCRSNTVHDNDFSFNGGWGVCMARSSDNVVSWNRMDFVNRTWAGGWGGDSASIGVADDSDHNFFVGNSMTHSGDGFFLSNRNDVGFNQATGLFDPRGGSDRNVIASNDGSWSTANAFEGTFSLGNVYIDNQANRSNYGYWLGFSSDTLLAGNTIVENLVSGIAIEHGKANRIVSNRLTSNARSAIHLWAADEKPRAPFPSTSIDIVGNTISGSPVAFDLTGSTDVLLKDNNVSNSTGPDPTSASRSPLPARQAFDASEDGKRLQEILATKPPGWRWYTEMPYPQGVQWLRAEAFAPQDFRGQLAAVRDVDPGAIELFLTETGVSVSAPDFVGYDPTPENPRLVRISVRPDPAALGTQKPYRIVLTAEDGKRKQVLEGTLQTVVWNVKWFDWHGLTYDDSTAWKQLFASKPLVEETTRLLGGDYTGRSPAPGVPKGHFAMVATTKFQVPPGRYRFNAMSDDGIRVFLDGKEIISRWNHHGPTPDEVTLTLDPAAHALRVEYCQEDGAAVLRLAWTRVGQ
jgi:parallel beta-helix repeat protein